MRSGLLLRRRGRRVGGARRRVGVRRGRGAGRGGCARGVVVHAVAEGRRILQLVLREVNDAVVRVAAVHVGAVGGRRTVGGGGAGRRGRAGGAGRRRIGRHASGGRRVRGRRAGRRRTVGRGGRQVVAVIFPLDRAERQRHVLLAHPEEAADADDDRIGIALAVDQDLVDVADLLVVLAVDVDADELGGAPLVGVHVVDELAGVRRRGA